VSRIVARTVLVIGIALGGWTLASGCGGTLVPHDAADAGAADARDGASSTPDASAAGDASSSAPPDAPVLDSSDSSTVPDGDAGSCPPGLFPPVVGSPCTPSAPSCSYGGDGPGTCASASCHCAPAGLWTCDPVDCATTPPDGCPPTPPVAGTLCSVDLEICFYPQASGGCPLWWCSCDDISGAWSCGPFCAGADAGGATADASGGD
jgi:hypothetical protein